MSRLVKSASSAQIEDCPTWTADTLAGLSMTEYFPMAAYRGNFKVYIEDDFPWWSLPFGSLDDKSQWIVVGANGIVKTSRAVEFDTWVGKRTERKSKRYYVVVKYFQQKDVWKCDLNHNNIDVADIEKTLFEVLGTSTPMTFQQTVYSMELQFMNVRSFMYAVGTDESVSQRYTIAEKKMPAAYSNVISVVVSDGDSQFDVTISKDRPQMLLIKNVVHATEDRITTLCNEMSRISENSVVAYQCMMQIYGVEYDLSGRHAAEALPSGYARYASTSNVIVPQIIGPREVDQVRKEGREVLEHNGKLWTCPLGYFPYVTDNRKMNNNDTEPTIIKCNTRAKPNTQRHTAESHYVFSNSSHMVQEGDRGIAPGAIRYHLGTSRNLVRVGVKQDAHSFLRCVFKALRFKKDPVAFRTEHDFNPWIAKQENPFWDPEDIVAAFRDTNRSLDSSRFYRIVEEAFDVDIVLIDSFKDDTIRFHLPPVDDIYIWHPRLAKTVIGIIRNHTVESGAFKMVHHELIAFDEQPTKYDLADSYIIANKVLYVDSQSCTYDHRNVTSRLLPYLSWEAQQLNDGGHCIALRTKNFWLTCFDRPHALPVEKTVEEDLPDARRALAFVRKVFPERSSYVDVQGRNIIGVWTDDTYCPTKTTPLKTMHDVKIGRRCMELKRSIFGEESNRSKQKSVTILGVENLQTWINANKSRHENEHPVDPASR